MDEILLKKMEQKIQDTISNKDEIKQLIQFLSNIDDSKSFALGIIVGRLYNSFYYQSKRILQQLLRASHHIFSLQLQCMELFDPQNQKW